MSLEGIPNDSVIRSTSTSFPGQAVATVLDALQASKAGSAHVHPEYTPRGGNVTAASGTALELDIAGRSDFEVTWTGDAVVTFANVPSDVTSFMLFGYQGGAGNFNPTFPDVDSWELAQSPVFDGTVGAMLALGFYTPDGGTTWRGLHGQRIVQYPWSSPHGTNLAVTSTSAPWGLERPARLISVRLRCTVAPATQSILVDINKNGTTMFTTQANRPAIAASATASSLVTNADVTALAAGDVLTSAIDQVGTGTTGQGLSIIARVLEA